MPGFPLDRRNELWYVRSTLYDDGTIRVSDWPKADPVTAPKVDFTLEAWQRLAMERGDEIARLGELVKLLDFCADCSHDWAGKTYVMPEVT